MNLFNRNLDPKIFNHEVTLKNVAAFVFALIAGGLSFGIFLVSYISWTLPSWEAIRLIPVFLVFGYLSYCIWPEHGDE